MGGLVSISYGGLSEDARLSPALVGISTVGDAG